MKKIYISPAIDRIELERPIMQGGGAIVGSKEDPFSSLAPKPRPDKPF